MRLLIVIKVIILSLLLVVILFSMKAITPDRVDRAFSNIGLDLKNSGAPSNTLVNDKPQSANSISGEHRKIQICKTRIQSIEFFEGHQIFEEADGLTMRWMSIKIGAPSEKQAPQKMVIDYIAMEKWLGKYCLFDAKRAGGPALGLHRIAILNYVDGSTEELSLASNGLIFWHNELFEVAGFESAWTELKKLAGLP